MSIDQKGPDIRRVDVICQYDGIYVVSTISWGAITLLIRNVTRTYCDIGLVILTTQISYAGRVE